MSLKEYLLYYLGHNWKSDVTLLDHFLTNKNHLQLLNPKLPFIKLNKNAYFCFYLTERKIKIPRLGKFL